MVLLAFQYSLELMIKYSWILVTCIGTCSTGTKVQRLVYSMPIKLYSLHYIYHTLHHVSGLSDLNVYLQFYYLKVLVEN